MKKSTMVRAWVEREQAEEWSPYGDQVWERTDPDRREGVMFCVAGRTLRIVFEAETDTTAVAADITLGRDDARALAAFLHDRILRPD